LNQDVVQRRAHPGVVNSILLYPVLDIHVSEYPFESELLFWSDRDRGGRIHPSVTVSTPDYSYSDISDRNIFGASVVFTFVPGVLDRWDNETEIQHCGG
jgi:hypothetical protein